MQLAYINSTSRLCIAWYYDASISTPESAKEMLGQFMALLETEGVMQRSVGSIVK